MSSLNYFQNGFQNDMQQPSLPDLAVQQMLALGNDIRGLNQAVMANNQYMLDTVQTEIARSERERRKQRKREIQSQVAVVNSMLGLVTFFDDGTKNFTALTINLVPEFEIYIFQLQGLEESEKHFGIHFGTPDFWIIGEKEKVARKWLYDSFIKNDIRFNSQIPESKIKTALYEFFMPKVWAAESRRIPALAGWFHKEFLSAETFWFREREGFLNLPIRKKLFQNYSETPLCTEGYFEKIKEISDWKNRLWMMIYPIEGMLSSLFWEAGISQEKYLNFVILEDIPTNSLNSYLEIFNRNRQSDKIIGSDDILRIKDEVIVLDTCSGYGESRYKKEQKIHTFQSIADGIVKGEFITQDGFVINSPVAIFSNRIARKRSAVNIFVGTDFFAEGNGRNQGAKREDWVGIVFHHFVKYVERNFDDIKNLLNMEIKADSQTAGLCFSFEIFQRFWQSYGVDLQMMAGLPETINFRELLQDNLYFEDDLISDFVKVVRQEIWNWEVIPKSLGKWTGEEIVYTEEYIWIPVKVLNRMFSSFGILDQKVQFLEKLKLENQMITDEKGISRKLQVAGKRCETYQFKRSLFHIPGTVDIVELGKEDSDAER